MQKIKARIISIITSIAATTGRIIAIIAKMLGRRVVTIETISPTIPSTNARLEQIALKIQP